jgi:transposase
LNSVVADIPAFVQELLDRIARLEAELAKRDRELAAKDQRIAELERIVEDLRRRGKRQAAPFSKGAPSPNPKPPGRKPGEGYGRQALPAVPKRVDETIRVPCPLWCRHCHGRVRLHATGHQYVLDLPKVRPQVTEFVVDFGYCVECGRRAQGRHPRQISNALDVGAVQAGPGVISFAAYLNKVGGLSYGKTAAVIEQMAGLRLARSTYCRALLRLAGKAEPSYQRLVESVRGAPVVYPDETGWRIGGLSAWLWAVATPEATVYAIERGRGYAEACRILGEDYAGVIGADGWAPYRRFQRAQHQTCLAHLLRRCQGMIEMTWGRGRTFPARVRDLLLHALELRDRYLAGEISQHGARVARGFLLHRLDDLLAGGFSAEANRRLAGHLRRNREAVFFFVDREDVEATNWPAEQAVRPAVVNRKVWGGNRTTAGARAQAVLMSVLRTCRQQLRDPIVVFSRMLRSPQPRVQLLLPAS